MEEVPKKIRKNVDHKAKRAMRRKRNMIARAMKMNKAQHEKRIEPKRKREKFSVKEAEEYMAEEGEDRSLHMASQDGERPETQRQGN